MTHLAFEMVGPKLAGRVLGALSLLFTSFLERYGFTCALRDLILNSDAEAHRKRTLRATIKKSTAVLEEWAKKKVAAGEEGEKDQDEDESKKVAGRVEKAIRNCDAVSREDLEGEMLGSLRQMQ